MEVLHRMAHRDSAYEDFNSDQSDDDLQIEPEERKSANVKQTTKQLYLKACDHYGAMPLSQYYKHTGNSKISLKNCSIGDTGIKPVAVSLVKDMKVQCLNLEDNGIGSLGGSYLAEMLTENITLTHLNLAENSLGSQGARIFSHVMLINTTITHLNLAGNGFSENDAVYFSEILEKNTNLKELDLSHNAFNEIGGQLLYHGIVENNTLEVLDIGWNHLRKTGAVAICKALQLNSGLVKLNLEWNGFGEEGALAIGAALAENGRLAELNLSANRITFEGFMQLLRGLSKNSTLKFLKMRNNPILKNGATALLHVIINSAQIGLESVDISDITVDDEFMEVLHRVKDKRPDIDINFGKVLSQKDPAKKIYEIVETPSDPLLLLFEHIKFNGFRLIDFFNRIDKDKNSRISREELINGFDEIESIRQTSISKYAVDKIMAQLDTDGNGDITFDELLVAHKEHTKKMMKKRMVARSFGAELSDIEKWDGVRLQVKTIMEQRASPDPTFNSVLKPSTPQRRSRTPKF